MKIRDRIKSFKRVKAGGLLPNPKNWRVHPETQQNALRGILAEVGWADAVLARETKDGLMLIDGHLRAEVAPDEKVPVLVLDVDANEADKILATHDPLAAMATADATRLESLLGELEFENEDLQKMLDELSKEAGVEASNGELQDPEPQLDRAEELLAAWDVKPGQLWEIKGKQTHRLLCGDSTKGEDVKRVIGGEKAALVSDPPYGIDFDPQWPTSLKNRRGAPPTAKARIVGDDGSLDLEWLYDFPEWIVFGFPMLARDQCYTGLMVWDKRGDGGEGGIGTPVEVAASNTFNGYRLIRHVWAGYVREAGEKREPHPTQKPIGVMADAIQLVKAKILFDPFLGSGTTMVAAEQLDRRCFGIEIEPRYVAVALERMAVLDCKCSLVESRPKKGAKQ